MEQVGLELLAKNAGQYIADIARSERATQQFTGGLAKTKDFDAFEQIAIGAFRRVGEAAVDLAANAGQQLIGFLGDSVSVAGDFESGMNEFAAVAGQALEESGVSLEQFRDQFIDIGKELPVSTSEVQQAAIELVKGGLDPATIAAGGLRQTLQFAAAAGMDLEQAATIAAKAVGGWTSPFASAQEKADFLTHSTDLLARAANASTVNVDDLALGLYNVQGTAKLAGASFDETVTALAQLAPSFSSSADAGTSFKTFLARLQPATKPAIGAMESLGLWTDATGSAFYNAKGEFVGMERASQLLYEATKGLTEAEREQYLQTIFGQDAIRAAAVFAEQGAAGYDLMSDSLAKQNSVAEMAAQKQKGFNTALDNAKGSLEALQITVGSAIIPILTTLLNDYIAPGINAVSSFAEEIFNAQDPVQALADKFNGLMPGLGDAVLWLGTNIPRATQFMANLWKTTLQPAIAMIGAWLGENIPRAAKTTADFWTTTLEPALQEVWRFMQDNVIPILSDIAETALPILDSALQVAASFWENVLKPGLKVVWDFMNAFVVPMLKTLFSWLKQYLPPAIQTVAGFLTDTLFPAFKTVAEFADKTVIPVLSAVAEVVSAVLGVAVKALAGIWQNVLEPALRDAANYVNEKLGPTFKWLKENVLDPVAGAIGRMGDKVGDLIGWLRDLAKKLQEVKLPDWMTPGSPTPLEIGLDGINRAMSQLATTQLPALQMSMERITPVASPNAIANSRAGSIQNTYNRTYNMPVYTTQSPAVVQQSMQIAQALAL